MIMLGLTVGSVVGNYLPLLWGGDTLSMSSLLLSAVGGLLGIWAGYKIGDRMF
jgi:hypothetical protein